MKWILDKVVLNVQLFFLHCCIVWVKGHFQAVSWFSLWVCLIVSYEIFCVLKFCLNPISVSFGCLLLFLLCRFLYLGLCLWDSRCYEISLPLMPFILRPIILLCFFFWFANGYIRVCILYINCLFVYCLWFSNEAVF